ncbi:hypothetical protein AJ80_05508 [Polytolypa hystricis UAMH7299]|uniref:ribonuclease H n=1 Tax=Polytolypa hystricis (strain UAMH7299) TaxID=1447883 RepID=A0A2B7Y371_POLH7|nr:hypothetical protein AJ80_05508 [Polytolypa hystricis UAMH7299]
METTSPSAAASGNVKSPSGQSPPPAPFSSASPDQHSTADSSQVVGTKRKRSTEAKFYAVKVGFQPGVYYRWDECLTQVTGFKGAVFQSFPSLAEANAFLTGSRPPSSHGAIPTVTKYYAIQRGRKPGVYTDWAIAQDQVRGFRGPKYRKFATWAEADAFVKEGQANQTDLTSGSTSSSVAPAPGTMTERPKDELGNEYPPGTGPLPPGAEDGFDPNVLLDPTTGKLVYKTPQQLRATKHQAKPPGPPGMLRIYTDGSSLRNGTTIAKAGVGVYFGPGDESRNVSEPLKGTRQTNQRAELTAIVRALGIAPRHRDVTIFTDSKYAIDCVTVWFVKWQRNKWMTSDHKPVENKDLIQSILVKIEERTQLNVKTLFEWVKGHNRDPGNEAADRLALNGAKSGAQRTPEELAEEEGTPASAGDRNSRIGDIDPDDFDDDDEI